MQAAAWQDHSGPESPLTYAARAQPAVDHASESTGLAGPEVGGDPLSRALKTVLPRLWVGITCMLAASGFALAAAWYSGSLAAELIGQAADGGDAVFPSPFLGWSGLLVAQAAFAYASAYQSSIATERFSASLQRSLFEQLQALPLDTVHRRSHGDVVSLLTNDTSLIGSFVGGALVGFVPSLLTCVGASLILIAIAMPLALVVLSVCCLLLLGVKVLGRRIRSRARSAMQAYATRVSVFDEGLRILPLIKSLGVERERLRDFGDTLDAYVLAMSRYYRTQLALAPAVQAAGGMAICALGWWLATRVKTDVLAVDEFVRILALGFLVVRPVGRVAAIYGQSRNALAARRRLLDVFEHAREDRVDGALVELVSRPGHHIHLDKVSFSHPGRTPLFEGLTLDLPSGRWFALNGDSGSGKSTLARIIMRLVLSDGGHVTIDGVSADRFSVASYRRALGYLSQETHLLNASLRQNVLLGRSAPPEPQLRALLADVGLLDTVDALSSGPETDIGDQGLRLSGGQRQRLALARALLDSPGLLILDEALCMLDPAAERACLERMRERLPEATILMITHSPACLELADEVLSLVDGRIVAQTSPSGVGRRA